MTTLKLSASTERRIQNRARRCVSSVRSQQSNYFNSFIQQFSLSSPQGMALMGLAEALIRVPDAATANALIYDKLSDQEWDQQFVLHSPALSKLAANSLSLAGQWLEESHDPETLTESLTDLLKQSSKPLIRAALKEAMKYLGQHFVCAESIDAAIKQSNTNRQDRVTYSYDMLGEAALCQDDVDRYMADYQEAIRYVAAHNANKQDNASVSIKLSALHPNFHGLKRQDVLKRLGDRLLLLTQLAYKLDVDITVDAEEADRQSLTLELFEQCLAHPSIKQSKKIGIAVQAYSKKALSVLQQIKKMAETHQAEIPVRLVKGAYWDTEIKNAQALGVEDYPVFTHKYETDINYLSCAHYLLSESISSKLIPRFATHNAYTLAAVIEIAEDLNYTAPLEIQRLFGMGEVLHQAVLDDCPNITNRVYSPVGDQQQLLPYLIRRLLENGANSSFVHQLFDPKVSEDALLISPFDQAETRSAKSIPKPTECLRLRYPSAKGFMIRDPNELEKLLSQVRPYYSKFWHAKPLIPKTEEQTYSFHQTVKPRDTKIKIGEVAFTSKEQVTLAIDNAATSFQAWSTTECRERVRCLLNIADLLQENMPKFIALLQVEAGKTLQDAIDEVREAIDFCRYYAEQMEDNYSIPEALPGISGETNTLSYEAKGIFVCISPWNFPLAIFTGQIVAALVTGNTVLAKPAESTSLIAYEVVLLMHQAGVPEDVLQLVPGVGIDIGEVICTDERVSGIAFTGSTRAAKQLQRGLAQRESAIATLIAETGGQNVMIVDSTALPEQVVKDVIQSAFLSAGQRCSALRILYLQEDIAEKVITLLLGVMQELTIDDPENPETDIGPIINQEAKQRLELHINDCKKQHYVCLSEQYTNDKNSGYFINPTLIEINSIEQLSEEYFGPILHIIRYDLESLDQIIEGINNTGYGLTFGVHSRNQHFCENLANRMSVGNIYINRNTVGARVGCQPFGGIGSSGTGPKAGGTNYLKKFMVEKITTTNTSAIGGDPLLMK